MKASIIIPVWNGREYLRDCLDAVLAQDYPDFEVIAVDNASTDGSADFVAEQYPDVRLILYEENRGFAKACNAGLCSASGEVLILLNQDTEVQLGWLTALIKVLRSDPQVGIVGGKALYPDGRIQHAGGHIDMRGAGVHYGHGDVDMGQHDQRREVDYVTGAGLAITRQAYDLIGPLDEGFSPAYYEDVDWCYRASEVGFRVVYVPQAVMIHEETSSLARPHSYEGMYLPQRNRLRFVLKHWPTDRLLDEFLPHETAWLQTLDEGGERLVAVMHRVYLFHLLHLQSTLRARAARYGSAMEDVDPIAHVLLTLRAVTPLRPARLFDESPDQPAAQTALLRRLHEGWSIEPRPFQSDVPVIGPLIVFFRRQWNRVATEWYVRPMIQQQVEFNAEVVTMLKQLHRDYQRLAEVLAEYLREDGREIAELGQAIQDLAVSMEKD